MPFVKVFFRLEVDKQGFTPPKKPFLAISNHGSFMDFAIVMLVLYPLKLNAVTAQKYFYYKPLHRLLPMMGCIPKNLFDTDVRSIIGIKSVLAHGGNVLLFPEGRCECDGVYVGMHQATGKLIKKLHVPVVSCSVDGAYSCMPFWRRGIRNGRVRVVVANLFSEDDLQVLSVDEINAAVDRRLGRDEDPSPRRFLGALSKKRLAEGLHNILYWCPKCGQEFTTQTDGCVIRCTACGFACEVDGAMGLQIPDDTEPPFAYPKSVHEWFKAQAEMEARKLHENMESISVNVQVRLPSNVPGGGMNMCGAGVLSMDTTGWHFDGELCGERKSLFFPLNTVPALPFDPDDVFQIYAHGTFYCFVPERPRESVKYSVIGECAYWRFSSDLYMTSRKDSGFLPLSAKVG